MASFRATFSTEQNLNAQFGDNGLNLRTGFGDVIEAPGSVRYDVEQELSEEDQARARQNIGALGEGEGGTDAALFVAEASFTARTAPVTFTFNKSSRELYEALESADARQKGLAGVFYANVDGQRYAVPATLSEVRVVLGLVYLGAIIFAPNATPLGFTVTLSDDPMTVEVPVSILKSVFDYTADVDQLVRTEAQSLTSVQKTQARQNIGAGTYSKPTTGIPESDLANAVKNKINNAATSADLTAHTSDTDIHVTDQEKDAWDAKYDKPSGGIPKADLASGVQQDIDEGVSAYSGLGTHVADTGVHFTNATEKTSTLQTVDENAHKIDDHTADTTIHVTSANKTTWNGKYTKPSGGIPESDLDATTQSKINGAASNEDLTAHTDNADIHVTAANKISWAGKYTKPGGGIPDTDLADKYAGAAVAGGTANKTAAIPFGQVDGTSTATVFTATIDGITELKNGVCMFLMNGVVTSASGFTINVNGLGAKPVYQTMAAATRVTTLWNVNYTMLFVYNEGRVTGGCWDMYYGYNSDTNTLAYNIRVNNSPGVMNKALYRYELMFTLPDGKIEPSNTTSNKPTTYTKALTTESFNPFEPIYYYSTTTTIAADAAASASYSYTQYASLDLRYAFNAGSTLTANKAIYLRCTPQGDCLVKLDGNDCVVQALPSTEDGKVYIYLGKTYSTYQIWLSQNHPIYEYKGGKLKLWDGTI